MLARAMVSSLESAVVDGEEFGPFVHRPRDARALATHRFVSPSRCALPFGAPHDASARSVRACAASSPSPAPRGPALNMRDPSVRVENTRDDHDDGDARFCSAT
jgi:hypothetical protein